MLRHLAFISSALFISIGSLAACGSGAGGSTQNASANVDGQSQILIQPMDSTTAYYGKTYPEWAVAWETWSLNEDPTAGASDECSYFQEYPGVFFLAGIVDSSGAESQTKIRSCTISQSDAILVPLMAGECDDWAPQQNGVDPGRGATFEQLHQCAVNSNTPLNVLEGTIEDIDLNTLTQLQWNQSLEAWHEDTGLYDYTTTANNDLQAEDSLPQPVPPGKDIRSADDGWYLLVAPLSPGQHTIHWHASVGSTNTFGVYDEDVTYILTVQ